jgi:hypothetical protein
MRRVSDSFVRASEVLQSGKSALTESCKQLIIKDVAKKLGEYFELKDTPSMEIVYENGVYVVKLSFQAERVKKFNVLR